MARNVLSGEMKYFSIYDAPLQPLIESILASAGVELEIQLRDLEGGRAQDLEITRWKNKGITLMALLGTTREGDVMVEGLDRFGEHFAANPHQMILKRSSSWTILSIVTHCRSNRLWLSPFPQGDRQQVTQVTNYHLLLLARIFHEFGHRNLFWSARGRCPSDS